MKNPVPAHHLHSTWPLESHEEQATGLGCCNKHLEGYDANQDITLTKNSHFSLHTKPLILTLWFEGRNLNSYQTNKTGNGSMHRVC